MPIPSPTAQKCNAVLSILQTKISVKELLAFLLVGGLPVSSPILSAASALGAVRSNSPMPGVYGDDFFRSGLGPSLRMRSVICSAAFANAWAWLPDM